MVVAYPKESSTRLRSRVKITSFQGEEFYYRPFVYEASVGFPAFSRRWLLPMLFSKNWLIKKLHWGSLN